MAAEWVPPDPELAAEGGGKKGSRGDGDEGDGDGSDGDEDDEWHMHVPAGGGGMADEDVDDLFRGFTFRREASMLAPPKRTQTLTRSTSRQIKAHRASQIKAADSIREE